ncbi:MAG: histidine kinase [Candidatus Viridilinea halotolerans]|uniref:Histidine kinase n=1 Tax=Candidatus Viridilinea halotolerans TaxID=2491704 RepID=A0A426TUA8_9CHLR|nr:MAG: histidine kinase [Candidatus Viridilinea halotolerans]
MATTQRCVYIATLGAQPQVVTLALDRLLARGEPIDEVLVVHLSLDEPCYRTALARVAQAFANEQYAGRHIRYRPLAIRAGSLAHAALRSEGAVQHALDTLQVLLRQLKEANVRIHLCVAGGHSLLGMLALTAAMLYFDHSDAIWHLASSAEVCRQSAAGAQMHLPLTADVQLVRIPLEPWGHLFPLLRTPPNASCASSTVQRRANHDAQNGTRCAHVLARLTERQREVLAALVAGLTIQEISAQLCIVISTVHAHKKQIFAECAIAWELDATTRADAHWLRETFAPHMDLE